MTTQKNFKLSEREVEIFELLARERDDLSSQTDVLRWALGLAIGQHERELEADFNAAIDILAKLEADLTELPAGEPTWHRAQNEAYIILIGDHTFRLDESSGKRKWWVARPVSDDLVGVGTIEGGEIKWLRKSLDRKVIDRQHALPEPEINWKAIPPADG